MRAEGPKERPTAVLSDQLSARMLHAICPNTADHKISKYYALTDITLLRFDVRIIVHAARAPPVHTQEIKSERYRDCDVELFCSSPRVPWCQQPARPRIKLLQPAYSQGPSDEDPQSVDH